MQHSFESGFFTSPTTRHDIRSQRHCQPTSSYCWNGCRICCNENHHRHVKKSPTLDRSMLQGGRRQEAAENQMRHYGRQRLQPSIKMYSPMAIMSPTVATLEGGRLSKSCPTDVTRPHAVAKKDSCSLLRI